MSTITVTGNSQTERHLPSSAKAVRVPADNDSPGLAGRVITGLLVTAPLAGLVVASARAWGHGLSLTDVYVAVAFYALAGHGVTVGFHRYLTHGSFTATRPRVASPSRAALSAG